MYRRFDNSIIACPAARWCSRVIVVAKAQAGTIAATRDEIRIARPGCRSRHGPGVRRTEEQHRLVVARGKDGEVAPVLRTSATP